MEHDCCQPSGIAHNSVSKNKEQGLDKGQFATLFKQPDTQTQKEFAFGGDKKMKNNYFVPIVVGLILLLTIAQAFQISALKANSAPQITSAAVSTNAQAGETYEQMMARMHPDQVSAQPVQQSAGPSMVGGC